MKEIFATFTDETENNTNPAVALPAALQKELDQKGYQTIYQNDAIEIIPPHFPHDKDFQERNLGKINLTHQNSELIVSLTQSYLSATESCLREAFCERQVYRLFLRIAQLASPAHRETCQFLLKTLKGEYASPSQSQTMLTLTHTGLVVRLDTRTDFYSPTIPELIRFTKDLLNCTLPQPNFDAFCKVLSDLIAEVSWTIEKDPCDSVRISEKDRTKIYYKSTQGIQELINDLMLELIQRDFRSELVTGR